MELRVVFPDGSRGLDEEGETIVVRGEPDITKAGFAAARAVRAWLKALPFVPSSADLHFHVFAEVSSDSKPAREQEEPTPAPRPKQKRKARK